MKRTDIYIKSLAVILPGLFLQCTEDLSLTPDNSTSGSNTATVSQSSTTSSVSCNCTYTVPAKTYLVDGLALGLKPGAVVCLQAGVSYANMVFRNLRGTASQPITIKNCGGKATINATGKPFGIKTELSSYFRITGTAAYGIRIIGGHQSLHFDKLTSDVEADHIEISGSGFAGIMAKTDPSCDNATIRGNFVMRNVLLHDNYIHETGGEGIYAGHTFYEKGVNLSCGTRLPHLMETVKIYNNVIKNAGWEAIQVGSTPTGAEVFGNRIENYGTKNVQYQNNGIQFGEGAPGKFYNNLIKSGKGIGLMIMGNAENFVHDNIFVNTGSHAIFCDERTAVGAGFTFINNTIVNPGGDGIRIYAETVPMNVVYNNIIVNPKSYPSYSYPRTGQDAYVYLLNKSVKIKQLNNYFTRDINAVKFSNAGAFNYTLTSGSPARNKGTNINAYNIATDYALRPRVRETSVDIGAHEY